MDSEPSPAELLHRIQDLFRNLGLLGQRLTLSYRGHSYLAACDEHSFTIYRLVAHCHLPPGRPGWPVCLVTEETIVDETSPPPAPEDEFDSGLDLHGWLEIIQETATTRG
jgi:hypothetical protein